MAGDSVFDKTGPQQGVPYSKFLSDSGFARPWTAPNEATNYNFFNPGQPAQAGKFDGFASFPKGGGFLDVHPPDWGTFGPNALKAVDKAAWPAASAEVQQPTPKDAAWKVVEDRHASPQDRLKAAEDLSKMPDGQKPGYRIATAHHMVNLFAKDEHGREHPVLRGISNGDGTYRNQVDKHGRPVDFEGTWWHKDQLKGDYATAKERADWGSPVQYGMEQFKTEYQKRLGDLPPGMTKSALDEIIANPKEPLKDDVKKGLELVRDNWDKLQDLTVMKGNTPTMTDASITDGMQARSDALDAASAALKQAGQTAPPPVDHEAAARHRVTPRRPVPPPQTEAPPERPHRRVPQNRPGEERPDLGTETPHREPRSTPLPPLPPNRTDRPPAETDSLRTRPNELAVPPQGPFSARRDIDTSKFDVGQPDVRTCGIAALTSALGDFDALHPIMQANGIGNTRDFMERMKSNKDTLTVPPHYDRRTGEYVEGGLQTGLDGLARAARDLGHLQTEMVHQQKGVDIMAQLDAQIIQGRGAIAHVINLGQGNPGYGGTHNPHYVYIAGKTPDGKNYIVNDSGHGTQRRSGFSHVYVETPEHVRRMIESKGDGFAAVWR